MQYTFRYTLSYFVYLLLQTGVDSDAVPALDSVDRSPAGPSASDDKKSVASLPIYQRFLPSLLSMCGIDIICM